MLVHIVMFQFKEENKESNLIRVKEMLEALPSKIDSLKSMEVGIDISHSDRSFDMVLTSMFEDQVGLDVYVPHPAHQEVVSVIKEGLQFVDSRTIATTKGREITAKYGMRYLVRDVFLDDKDGVANVKKQIKEAVAKAKRYGTAIAKEDEKNKISDKLSDLLDTD